MAVREAGRRLRRVAWRRPHPSPDVAPDCGPARLKTFARALRAQAPSVLRHGLDVSSGEATRRAQPDILPSDRVWHCDADAVVWCALDAPSHRTLLEWILDGPGAPTPTAVERTIVSECVDRLLATSADTRWRESAGKIRLQHDVWQLALEISGEGASASLRLFTAAEAQVRVTPHPVLDDVPLELRAWLRAFPVRLSDLASWQRGTVIRLSGGVNDIPTQVRVVGGPVMFGTLGCTNGHRAIRLNGSAARTGAR